MANIWRIVVLFLSQPFLMSVGSIAQELFTCDNGTEIAFFKKCDGKHNCEDGSDEICDNNAILFYYSYLRRVSELSSDCARYDDPSEYSSSYHFNSYDCQKNYFGSRQLNMTGVYLNENKEFSITVLNEEVPGHYRTSWLEELHPITNIKIHSSGRRLDILYRNGSDGVDLWKKGTRAGLKQNADHMEFNIKALVTDWLSSHVYLISNSTIKVCEENFVICSTLPSKFINEPSLLAISPKHRLLFWTEKMSIHQSYLHKYAIDMTSKIMVISKNLKNPQWLTVDVVQERIYWMDYGDDADVPPSIYSTTFGGTDHEVVPGTSSPTSSFVVFDNILYYSDTLQPQIWKCSVVDCTQRTIFRESISTYSAAENLHEKTFEVGALTLDHRPLLSETIQDACTNSSCSHLCTLHPVTFEKCYCEGSSDQPLPTEFNNGYCEDRSIIATYKNLVYVLGFFSHSDFKPIIRKHTINIGSISTVTYNSLKGNVILTEAGQQKIFSWTPRTRNLTLLSDDGLGTIKSIEFDDYANNLYWIDPVNLVIKVMNLDTRFKMTVLEGNSTYVPVELTLAPAKGYMFVQFLSNNSAVMIERISMDGRRIIPPIHMDTEIDDVESLNLHYVRVTNKLYLLDRQKNKIRYFLDDKSGFQDMTYSTAVGDKVQTITSLKNSIFWLEDNDVICRGDIEASSIVIASKISLGLKKNETNILKIAPVVSTGRQPRLTKCLRDNGGCEEICLVTDKMPRFVCACRGNRILINGGSCNLSLTTPPSTGPENGRINTENALTTRTDIMRKTESTCIKSCPTVQCPPLERRFTTESPSNQNVRIDVLKNRTGGCIESCPVCHLLNCSLTQEHQSPIYHIFNSIFIAFLALLLGFMLGYTIRKYRVEYLNSKFGRTNGTLELSRMQADHGSTMTLCSKTTNESSNIKRIGNVHSHAI